MAFNWRSSVLISFLLTSSVGACSGFCYPPVFVGSAVTRNASLNPFYSSVLANGSFYINGSLCFWNASATDWNCASNWNTSVAGGGSTVINNVGGDLGDIQFNNGTAFNGTSAFEFKDPTVFVNNLDLRINRSTAKGLIFGNATNEAFAYNNDTNIVFNTAVDPLYFHLAFSQMIYSPRSFVSWLVRDSGGDTGNYGIEKYLLAIGNVAEPPDLSVYTEFGFEAPSMGTNLSAVRLKAKLYDIANPMTNASFIVENALYGNVSKHLEIYPDGITEITNQSRGKAFLASPATAAGGVTVIPFDGILYDEHSEFQSTGVGPYDAFIPIRTKGYYAVTCSVWIEPEPASIMEWVVIHIYKNGASYAQQIIWLDSNGKETAHPQYSLDVTDVVEVTAPTDFIQCALERDGEAMLPMTVATGSTKTYAAIHKIS